MLSKIHNLFATNKTSQTTEQFITLLQTPHLQLEQIISYGTPSAAGFWYDQDKTEWVLLAKGEAVLEFADDRKVLLQSGDCLLIPAHEKHRVKSCSANAVWLALFFDDI